MDINWRSAKLDWLFCLLLAVAASGQNNQSNLALRQFISMTQTPHILLKLSAYSTSPPPSFQS